MASVMALLLAFASIPVGAAPPPHITKGKARLKNLVTGRTVEVPVEVKHTALGKGRHKAEITAYLPASALSDTGDGNDIIITPQASRNLSGSKSDDSYTVRTTMAMYWVETYVNNTRVISGEYFTTKWDRLDPTWSWSNASVVVGCHAKYWPSGANCLSQETFDYDSPTSGKTYTQTTSWSSQNKRISGIEYVEAISNIRMSRGSSAFWFQMTACIGGSSLVDCDVQSP